MVATDWTEGLTLDGLWPSIATAVRSSNRYHASGQFSEMNVYGAIEQTLCAMDIRVVVVHSKNVAEGEQVVGNAVIWRI